ncbi:uncharacterized protein LOC122662572 [Telopea speciosissima]|uniref:uncharacterized protein LOC122662572 n=1 Tax=Telopea speciosissima TaxID=54955 RepID=UPI001CC542D9|nr:uncharacterized protein LOC122662572 [Telopea speciosissima]
MVDSERRDCNALTLAVDEQAHHDGTDTHTDPDVEKEIEEGAVLTKSSSKETVMAQAKDLVQDSTTGDSCGASAASIADEGKEEEGKETMQSEATRYGSLDLDNEDEWIVLGCRYLLVKVRNATDSSSSFSSSVKQF